MAERLLRDTQFEVRRAAGKVLTTYFASIPSEGKLVDSAFDKYAKMSRARIAKREGDDEVKMQKLFRRRLAGVIGLGAIVLANPYSVPPMARQALLRLTHFVSDPSPICDAVKLVLADFQRTHRDEWFRHKQAFTPEARGLGWSNGHCQGIFFVKY